MYNIGKITPAVRSDLDRIEFGRSPLSNPTVQYICGGCGKNIHGTVVAKAPFFKGPKLMGEIYWSLCSCGQPAVVRIFHDTDAVQQWPPVIEFTSDAKWPDDLSRLFMDAALAFAAGAFTASAMLCRKILMVCAVEQGDADGKTFTQYVDYITGAVLTYPRAKASLDGLRKIGNDANHKVVFVTETEARKAMETAKYLLDAVYALPTI